MRATLRDVLTTCRERRVHIPADFACYVVRVLAEALRQLHAARAPLGGGTSFVHRAVLPSNVFLNSTGQVRLGDFSIKPVALDDGKGPPTERDYYLAPEEILGKPTSPATDIFSLGVLLYELLTNEPPFRGKNRGKVWDNILEGLFVPPSVVRAGLSMEIESMLLKMLMPAPPDAVSGKGPLKRVGSTAELLSLLARAYNPAIGNPMAIASLVRNLGVTERTPPTPQATL